MAQVNSETDGWREFIERDFTMVTVELGAVPAAGWTHRRLVVFVH
jgi:hypothetical protein